MVLQNALSQFTLLQLSDTFFPSGSFTLSHGLETLKQTGQVQSIQDLEDMIRYQLRFKIGPTDLVGLGEAYRASAADNMERIYQVDCQLWAYNLVEAARETQRKSGRALLTVAMEIWPHSQLETLAIAAQHQTFHSLHPVLFGVVSQVAGLSEWESRLGYTHSFVTGLVSAAIRLGLCGHIQSQKILSKLALDMEKVCQDSMVLSLDDLWTGVPVLDIAQMMHPNLQHHLFAN